MKKNKVLYFILILSIIVNSGLFYLNTYYIPDKNESLKPIIYVAIKDITAGTTLDDTNTKIMRVDKAFKNNIQYNIELKHDAFYGKIAVRDISKNVPILTTDIEESESTTEKFELNIYKGFTSNFEKGDTMRIYLQMYNKKTKKTFIFKVLDSEQVVNVIYYKNPEGVITGINNIVVNVSDQEALRYYNAKTIAMENGTGSDMIILKYNNTIESDYLDVLQFSIDSSELRGIIEDNAEYDEKRDSPVIFVPSTPNIDSNDDSNDDSKDDSNDDSKNDGTEDNLNDNTPKDVEEDSIGAIEIDYLVKDGESIEVISTNLGTSIKSIEESNPDIDLNSLEEGMIIKVKIGLNN